MINNLPALWLIIDTQFAVISLSLSVNSIHWLASWSFFHFTLLLWYDVDICFFVMILLFAAAHFNWQLGLILAIETVAVLGRVSSHDVSHGTVLFSCINHILTSPDPTTALSLGKQIVTVKKSGRGVHSLNEIHRKSLLK